MLLLFLSSTAQYVIDMTLSLEQMEAYLTATSVALADRRTVWLQTHEGLYMAQRWPTAFNVRRLYVNASPLKLHLNSL
jgi:hypothetical protein